MAFEWSEEIAVGNVEIDRQHQEIFKNYNKFLDACKNGKGRQALPEILDFMGTYVEDHFLMEERLMVEKKYPDTLGHKQEHQELRRMVYSLRENAAKDGPTLSLMTETNRKLLDFLVDHIRKSDKSLASFLKNQWGLL